jgi:hypothetical protein
MNKYFLAFLFLLVFKYASSQSDTLIWHRDSLLHNEDFLSKQKGNQFAFTGSGIHFYTKENNGAMQFIVEAIFLKSKSFMKGDSPYILKHEQLHFDITELYARKFRQKISERDFGKVKNIREEFSKMSKLIFSALDREQNNYDNDTEHGMNPVKQQLWVEKIAAQISELENFSATVIELTKK